MRFRKKQKPKFDDGRYSDQPYITDADAANLLGVCWEIVRNTRNQHLQLPRRPAGRAGGHPEAALPCSPEAQPVTDIDKLKDEVVEAARAFKHEDPLEVWAEDGKAWLLWKAVADLEEAERPDPLVLLSQADELLSEAAEETIDAGFDRRIGELQELIARALSVPPHQGSHG